MNPTTYLLVREFNLIKNKLQSEFPTRYGADELAEMFTADERAALAAGGIVTRTGKGFRLQYVDMVVAARATINTGAAQ